MVVDLKYPVEVNGTKIQSVNMRRPKGRDIYLASKGNKEEIDVSFELLQNLTEMSKDDLFELDAEDFMTLSQKVADFLNVQAPSAPVTT